MHGADGRVRDDGHHEHPGCLRGDDSILNCCLFFTLGIKTPRKVRTVGTPRKDWEDRNAPAKFGKIKAKIEAPRKVREDQSASQGF